MTTIQLAKKLPDSNDDGVVKVSAAGAKKYGVPKAGNWWGPLPGAPNFTYTNVKPGTGTPAPTPTPAPEPTPAPTPAPPPAPEPTTPPPPAGTTLTAAVVNGEAALQTPDMTVVLNKFGGIGQVNNAAIPGFRSDLKSGFARIGLYVPPLSDLVLQGRAIEGFGVIIAGKRYANMLLAGYYQIAGGFNGPLMWEGSVSGVEVTQNVTITGKTIRLAVTLRNTTKAALDLQYFRSIDPDQAGQFDTANKVVSAGVAECSVKGGKLAIRAPGADFHVTTYDKAPDIGTRREIGVSKTADEVVQAVFPRASLAADQSATYIVEYEVVTA
ncbi:hypothetical protein [Sphingomonas sp. Leaf10]|uniref:hypothetical protein n=1 Tax=Sphingomonas sp. Leaf10 TaxID=1735676 RepID=UPI000ACD2C54|nr:hypothetical protein [Sphingomonas sp. Leaf10]